MKTAEELRKLEIGKLMEELIEAKAENFKVSFQVNSGQAKNSHMIRNSRKYVALVKTIVRQKELEKELEQENQPEVATVAA